jgi:serine/threonine protein kinase
MKNVLEALQYIHKLKILHRDIKPDNLILRNHNDITDPVLVDFGLADFYSETGDYLFKDCGSIGYVAPEMLRN